MPRGPVPDAIHTSRGRTCPAPLQSCAPGAWRDPSGTHGTKPGPLLRKAAPLPAIRLFPSLQARKKWNKVDATPSDAACPLSSERSTTQQPRSRSKHPPPASQQVFAANRPQHVERIRALPSCQPQPLIPVKQFFDDKVRKYGTTGRGISARENVVIKTTKAIHILFATAWAGGAFSMQALSYLRLTGHLDTNTAHIFQVAGHAIDTCIVMPGLAGCVATGLFYSLCTSIGFFRYFWVGYKWLISMCAAFWGTVFWGPWGDAWIADSQGTVLAIFLRFVRSCLLPESFWQAVLQTVLIFSMLLISVYRPLTVQQALLLERVTKHKISLR